MLIIVSMKNIIQFCAFDHLVITTSTAAERSLALVPWACASAAALPIASGAAARRPRSTKHTDCNLQISWSCGGRWAWGRFWSCWSTERCAASWRRCYGRISAGRHWRRCTTTSISSCSGATGTTTAARRTLTARRRKRGMTQGHETTHSAKNSMLGQLTSHSRGASSPKLDRSQQESVRDSLPISENGIVCLVYYAGDRQIRVYSFSLIVGYWYIYASIFLQYTILRFSTNEDYNTTWLKQNIQLVEGFGNLVSLVISNIIFMPALSRILVLGSLGLQTQCIVY
ncbi:Transmembrane domain-containing protein [Spironucleus salmonicida]|uniref:Transmembrane domain-containing protein n=1 Tax=Spironucleus salmonicida TaxID=348837 RepID=V6LK83_9EUKA|nr:Transmembrane domain-containing protein [Spironucleus salmonicida]|eukprot:EST44151.1 Transmembrane domain-containing protein [Spironucleus salmonicida]